MPQAPDIILHLLKLRGNICREEAFIVIIFSGIAMVD